MNNILPAHNDLIAWFARRHQRYGKPLSTSPDVYKMFNEKLRRLQEQAVAVRGLRNLESQ